MADLLPAGAYVQNSERLDQWKALLSRISTCETGCQAVTVLTSTGDSPFGCKYSLRMERSVLPRSWRSSCFVVIRQRLTASLNWVTTHMLQFPGASYHRLQVSRWHEQQQLYFQSLKRNNLFFLVHEKTKNFYKPWGCWTDRVTISRLQFPRCQNSLGPVLLVRSTILLPVTR